MIYETTLIVSGQRFYVRIMADCVMLAPCVHIGTQVYYSPADVRVIAPAPPLNNATGRYAEMDDHLTKHSHSYLVEGITRLIIAAFFMVEDEDIA